MTYKINCINNHHSKVSPSVLEEILTFKYCPECDQEITDVEPEYIEVECPLCTWQESTHWSEVGGWLGRNCPRCGEQGFDGSIHVIDSFYYKTELYEHHPNIVDTESYKRGNRPDYWEIVTHYCHREELISILETGNIKASETGYYRKKAVCLTEIPVAYSSKIRNKEGHYGIAFRKKKIIENGGQPVINLTDQLIKDQELNGGFSSKVKPFVQLIRIPSIAPKHKDSKKVFFLHEREWRIASDINFNEIEPLGLVLPATSSLKKFSGRNWSKLFNAAFKYGEIRPES